MFNTIPQEATKAGTGFKFGTFMRLENNKTGRAKNPKVGVRGTGAMQTLIGSVIMNHRYRDTIDSVSSNESCFSPKIFRTRGREKEGSSTVENMPMFPFSTSILLRRTWTGTMRLSTMTLKEGKKVKIFIFHGIVGAKKLNSLRKLGFNHCSKIVIKLFELRAIFHKKQPCKTRKIVYKNNKITCAAHSRSGRGAPNIRMDEIKWCKRNRVTFIKR
ncbi:hypothetical protein CsSME_00016104 [Camellia sinensis var. sinensis]